MLTTVTFLGINSILISVGNNRGHLRLSTSDAAYKQEVVNTYQGGTGMFWQAYNYK